MPDPSPVVAASQVLAPSPENDRLAAPAAAEVPNAPSTPAVRNIEVGSKSAASEALPEGRALEAQPVPAPVRDPVVEETAERSPAIPAAEPEPKKVGPARLETAVLSDLVAPARSDAKPTRLNSATLGSAVGKAAPRGVQALTFQQRVDLAKKIRSQVTPCWNPPPADDSASVSVRLRFKLDRKGRVVGQPTQSAVTGQGEASAAYINLLTNSGRRAVLMCSPLQLPPELYHAWADVEVEFDPRDLP